MAKNSITIVNKNNGEKIPYFVGIGTNKISFNDELTLNLEKYERDDPAHIDICQDIYGNLVTGVIPNIAERYVAQIDIPAREYEKEYDDEGEAITIPQPFNISKCTLTLWSLNNEVNADDEL